MTQGVSSPQGSWLTPDWDVEPNVHALSTLRGGGLSAKPYASFNLAEHVGDDEEARQRRDHRAKTILGRRVHRGQ